MVLEIQTAKLKQSPSVQDYLKAVYRLEQSGLPAETKRLGDALGGLSSAAVTGMIKRLATGGLLSYTPYHGVSLTAEGRKLSLEVLRRHRLLELFLQRILDYPWEAVHTEAERLEHYVSRRFVDSIETLMGFPEFDPHGDPIPRADGSLPARESLALSDCPEGWTVQVLRFRDQSPESLGFFAACGLFPGVELRVGAHDADALVLCIGRRELRLDGARASHIDVAQKRTREEDP
jgi:DtxR family Mn-dependent transcriptional regulator